MPAEIESNLLSKNFALRTATKDDLDDITQIHVIGFDDEPATDYCCPFRDQYPEDYRKWTRKEYVNYLNQPEKYLVHVIETPSACDDKVAAKPAGFAVWNLAVLVEANDPGTLRSLRHLSLGSR